MADGVTIGWVGVGRMGHVLVERLLRAGCDVAVWNRTRAKAESLEEAGAKVVDRPSDLADRQFVVTMVSSSDVFEQVALGDDGILTRPGPGPQVLIDSSTISVESSKRVRERAETVGTALLAAPVSGNPKVAKSGRLSVVASGPREAFDQVEPILNLFGQTVTYVGDGDNARFVKICHNLLLAAVTQSLAETLVLLERAGISRLDYLTFINNSVMGSTFTRYKTPSLVNLDFTPTFTGHLLRKDLELGLQVGRELDVPLPLAAMVHQLVVHLIGTGRGDADFAALLELAAEGGNLELVAEAADVVDGLKPVDDLGAEP